MRRTSNPHPALLGLLPLLAVGAVVAGLVSAGTATAAGSGVLDARAELLPAPAAGQLMMPMDGGMQHADEMQVVLAVRNDTDAELTVPFDRIAVVAPDGGRVAATGGLVGDLVLRPHAATEERLRFPAPDSDHVLLSVPDGPGERILDLPVHGATPEAATPESVTPPVPAAPAQDTGGHGSHPPN